jgi:hypothetical protein
MLLRADNRILIQDQPTTYLTASLAATGTTLTVKDNSGFTANDFVLLGKIGEGRAEIKRISGAVTAGTSMTIVAATYAHDEDTPVTKLDYDQVAFWHAATTTAPATTDAQLSGSPFNVDPTEIYTYLEDTTNTTGYGFLRFKDSNAGTFSAVSDAIPYTGYTAKMLRSIRNKVRRLLNETDELNSPFTNEEINDEINIAQKEVAHDRMWSFYEKTKSFSSVANQYEYTLASDSFTLFSASFDTQPLAVIGVNRWNNLRWDTFTTGDPTHICMWRNKARVYPYPEDSADATTLNGALTAAATTVTVASTSDFDEQGRLIVDSEVISYTGLTSTTFTGCTRGDEGTTAATHLTAAAVTKRDFIYLFQEEPVDLDDETDETDITEPSILAYKAASELALRKNEDVLHDRLLTKSDRALAQLRKVDEPKIKSEFGRVTNYESNVSDLGVYRDPNDYPTGLV